MKPDKLQMRPNYWDRAKRALAKRDGVMAGIIRSHPKVFLARRGEPFLTLARAICGQQISVKAAQ
ncbi:MAG TPA: DNA-3-methyladenine glycosylase 2 family protein, partial [Burkholderiales bacterium]